MWAIGKRCLLKNWSVHKNLITTSIMITTIRMLWILMFLKIRPEFLRVYNLHVCRIDIFYYRFVIVKIVINKKIVSIILVDYRIKFIFYFSTKVRKKLLRLCYYFVTYQMLNNARSTIIRHFLGIISIFGSFQISPATDAEIARVIS